MGPSSQEKTVFATRDGLYKFRVMPFGVCNRPTMFQRLMQQTLRGLGECCSVYTDDMIFSGTVKEHVRHLRLVYDRQWEYSLTRQKFLFTGPELVSVSRLLIG